MDKTGDLQVKTCAHREHGTQVNVHTKAHAYLTQRPKHKWMPHLVLVHLFSHVVHTLSHHTASPPSPCPPPPRLPHPPHTLSFLPPSPFPSPPRLACSGHQRRTQAAFTRRDSRELRARPRQHHHRLRLPRERQPLGGAYIMPPSIQVHRQWPHRQELPGVGIGGYCYCWY